MTRKELYNLKKGDVVILNFYEDRKMILVFKGKILGALGEVIYEFRQKFKTRTLTLTEENLLSKKVYVPNEEEKHKLLFKSSLRG